MFQLQNHIILKLFLNWRKTTKKITETEKKRIKDPTNARLLSAF